MESTCLKTWATGGSGHADGIKLVIDGVRSLIDSVLFFNDYKITVKAGQASGR